MSLVLSEKCFADIVNLIHELTGITIAKNRTSMIEGRLRKRVAALSLSSYEGYLQFVKDNKSEKTQFIDLVTTNETYFYRTPRIWEYIENKYLPNWFATHPKQVFTAWSAAASSGEEAHTLAVICQAFKDKHPDFLFQIFGTDISNEMVWLCQQGKYTGKSIEAFKKAKPELFEKYLRKDADENFQVQPEIKSRLRFQQHNLFQQHGSSNQFDLILIRNVLIYFKAEDQEKVLFLAGQKLANDGALIIGESESLSHIKTPFKLLEPLIYKLDPDEISKLKAA